MELCYARQCWERLNYFSTYLYPGQSWWLAHSQGRRGSRGLEGVRCEDESRERGVARLLLRSVASGHLLGARLAPKV